jgi:hypothetical protein
MSILDLQAIRKRAEAATEGPWQCANTTDGPWILDDGDMIITGTCERDADGEFIAHARTDVVYLLDYVEGLDKLANKLEDVASVNRIYTKELEERIRKLDEKVSEYESLAQEYDYYAIIEAIEEDE